MQRPLKIKLVLSLGLALLVGAHVFLWAIISYRGPDMLQNYLSHKLGLRVEADRVKASLLSQGIRIKNLRLSDPGDENAKPFFTSKKVLLRLNLFALLAGRVTIRKIALFSPTLHVSRNSHREWVLPTALRKVKSTPETSPGEDALEPVLQPRLSIKAPKQSFFELRLHKWTLRQGLIFFDDQTISPPFWVRLKNIQGEGQFLSDARLHFEFQGQIEGKDASHFRIQGDYDLGDGKPTANIETHIDDLDLTLLAPYYQHISPLDVSEGRISLHSTIHCNEGILENSVQAITLNDLKIRSWKDEFLNQSTLGIPNRDVADYLEQHNKQLAVDFSVSGPVKDLRTLPALDAWKLLGTSAVDQWLGQGANR